MSDEQYIINLCDIVLERIASRQHRFDFLRGDKCKRVNGKIVEVFQEKGRKLPVDAYYEELNLVVEFLEIQHFESIKHFDKPDVITVSGVHRGKQRKIYDKRRRVRLAEKGICLIEFPYTDFNLRSKGKLVRDGNDVLIIRSKLRQFCTTKTV